MKPDFLNPPPDHKPIEKEKLDEWYAKILGQITPETRARVEKIVAEINGSDVDIEEGEMAEKIDAWINDAFDEIDQDIRVSMEKDKDSFEAEAWMYFMSLRE